MNVSSKMAWVGLLGGAFLLGAPGACFAATNEAPPTTAVAVATASDANANPYSVITERNPFRLNPPPPPPEPSKPPSPALPAVILSGFMRTGNQWKVLLSVKTENPDPHGQRITSYLALAEGEKGTVGLGTRQAVVELVKLYANQEKADIISAGAPITLSMKDNGFESAAPSLASSQAPPSPGASAPVARRGMRAAPLPVWQIDTNNAESVPVEAGKAGGGISPIVGSPPSIGGISSKGVVPLSGRSASGDADAIMVGGAGGMP
jgi:hypothetical protein